MSKCTRSISLPERAGALTNGASGAVGGGGGVSDRTKDGKDILHTGCPN